MYEHLVFYDGTCPFCHQAIRILLRLDRHKRLVFAPLKGETSKKLRLNSCDSMVLVQNFEQVDRKYFMRSKAVFRILWLVGGWWPLVGVLNFLPSFFFDWAYRLIALNRYKLLQATLCDSLKQMDKKRFLD